MKKLAIQSGFSEAGYVEIDNLKFYPEIRKICEGNLCRNYGTSWACPPAVGTLKECETRVRRYDKMLLFSKKYDLEDSFDFEGMKGVLTDYLLLSNEGCGRCAVCTYPDAPCRFPQLLCHSLEGYGFIVSELACEAGVRYNNGANTVTYFGALLFRENQ